MRAVDLPAWDPACRIGSAWGPIADKKMDCYQPRPDIVKVSTAGFAEKWPAAAKMLSAFTLSNEEQAPLIKRVDVDKESLETVAKSWVDANEAKWRPWVDGASK